MNKNTPRYWPVPARALAFACLLAVIAALLSMNPAAAQLGSVLYVTPTGSGDCSSWANACDLQTALAQAQPGSEIWVAAGTYTPTTGSDRGVSFVLKDEVALFGGFSGTETTRAERDWSANVTILSGDIGAQNNPSDNSLHVLKGANLSDAAVLDGFTVTGGAANLTGTDADGAGLYLTASSPAFENITFVKNTAQRDGGAVYSKDGSPSFVNSAFYDNESGNDGGAIYSSGPGLVVQGGEALRNAAARHGGAFYASYATFGARISDFHFAENEAMYGGAVSLSGNQGLLSGVSFHANSAGDGGGGALYTTGEAVRIDRATFTENTSALRGGAIYDREMYGSAGGAWITNSLFYKNSSANMGGAVYSTYTYTSSSRIINNTFYANSSGAGGAVASTTQCAIVRNSILWGNTASLVSPQLHAAGCTANIENSIVNGWTTNLDKKVYGKGDPLFLSTQAGSLDLRLRRSSPGVNTGSGEALPSGTLTDLDGNPRVAGESVDMGAYEQQSPNHTPVLNQPVFEMPAILEDATSDTGILVADLIGGAVSDADGDPAGIAITQYERAGGTWIYLPEGGEPWQQIWGCNDCRALLLGPNARLRFYPDPNWNGTQVPGITFRVWDTSDGRETGALILLWEMDSAHSAYSKEAGRINITVQPVNDPPAYAGAQPPYLTGAPVPGQPLTVVHGPWNDSIDSPESAVAVTYQWQIRAGAEQPWGDIPGATAQTYTLTPDGLGKEISALVIGTDSGVGEPPSTSAETRSTVLLVVSESEVIAEGATAAVTMDEDGSPAHFALALHPLNSLVPEWQIGASPQHGTAAVSSAGVVTYQPADNYHGTDTFTVQAVVGILVDTIRVDVTIRPRNDAPVAAVQPALLGPARYGYAVNAQPGEWNDNLDLQPGTLSFTYSWQTAPALNGTYTTIAGANTLAYTPQAADAGRYLRVVVRASDDGEGAPASMVSEAYSAAVLVTNTAPVIAEGAALEITGSPVQLHATDADNNPLTWQIGSPPSHGTAEVDALGRVSYRVHPSCTGMDAFTVTVTDGAASASIILRPPAGTCHFYVDDTAAGANNGASWSNAFVDLQTALAEASAGDEIWVAAGTYYPTQLTDRAATFQLKEGVALYGGFRGDEAGPGERDWKATPAILSGDIGTRGVNTDNSYHVVSTTGLTASAVLDGFVITGGNANGSTFPTTDGGGGIINNLNSSPTLRNLRIENNYGVYGGGMINVKGSRPTLADVEFAGNQAYRGGGLYNTQSSPTLTDVLFLHNTVSGLGGGMSSVSSSSPYLTRVTFHGNVATVNEAGALENDSGSLFLMDVVFRNNSAPNAGAMRLWGTNAMLVNVRFTGNSAAGSGGAVRIQGNSTVTMVNTLFAGNSAGTHGGGIETANSQVTLVNTTFSLNQAGAGGAIYSPVSSTMVVRSSILWGNSATTAPEVNNAALEYAIVKGRANDPAKGVYGDEAHNPRFAAPDFGDFRLLGGSPAIDGGLSSHLPADTLDLDADGDITEPLPLDLDRGARVRGANVDLGAYEVQEPPTSLAVNDTIPAFPEDSAQELDVLANDPGSDLTITAVTQGSKGSASIEGSKVRYTPAPNANGTDSFTYTVSSDAGLTGTATVYLTILPVNDHPYLDSFADTGIITGGKYEAVFTIFDDETGANALLISVQSSNKTLAPDENITVTGSGYARTLTIIPAPGKTGVTTITVTVTDADGGTASESFTLTVKARMLYLPVITQ